MLGFHQVLDQQDGLFLRVTARIEAVSVLRFESNQESIDSEEGIEEV